MTGGKHMFTVSVHNFRSQNFKLSVSIPKHKYVVYVSVLSRISNCQGLGRKNKHEHSTTDRNDHNNYDSDTNDKYNNYNNILLLLLLQQQQLIINHNDNNDDNTNYDNNNNNDNSNNNICRQGCVIHKQ